MRTGATSRLSPWLAIAAVIALGAVYYSQGVAPNIHPKRFDVVQPGVLYRSGTLTPGATRRVVTRHEIRTIIDLGAAASPSRADRLAQRTAENLGVTRYRLELSGDGTGNPNCYLYALRLAMDEKNQPVLIHCGAGTERTGVAVALYRMLIEGWTREEAMAEAVEAGHDPDRNSRFSTTLDDMVLAIGVALSDETWVAGADPLTPEQLAPTNAGRD